MLINLKNLPQSLRLLLFNIWTWVLDRIYDLRTSWGALEEENTKLLALQREYIERIDFLQKELILLRSQVSKLETEKNRYQDEHLNDLRRVADRFCINATGKSLFGAINPVELEEELDHESFPPIASRFIHGADLKQKVVEYRRKQRLAQEKQETVNHGG